MTSAAAPLVSGAPLVAQPAVASSLLPASAMPAASTMVATAQPAVAAAAAAAQVALPAAVAPGTVMTAGLAGQPVYQTPAGYAAATAGYQQPGTVAAAAYRPGRYT